MAKKEDTFSFKSIFRQFMQKSLQSLVSVVAEHADNISDWIKNISGFKRKIRKMLAAAILLSAGLSVAGIGASIYIASLYPKLGNGISHIAVGITIILVATVYLKFKEWLNIKDNENSRIFKPLIFKWCKMNLKIKDSKNLRIFKPLTFKVI